MHTCKPHCWWYTECQMKDDVRRRNDNIYFPSPSFWAPRVPGPVDLLSCERTHGWSPAAAFSCPHLWAVPPCASWQCASPHPPCWSRQTESPSHRNRHLFYARARVDCCVTPSFCIALWEAKIRFSTKIYTPRTQSSCEGPLFPTPPPFPTLFFPLPFGPSISAPFSLHGGHNVLAVEQSCNIPTSELGNNSHWFLTCLRIPLPYQYFPNLQKIYTMCISLQCW